MKIIQRTYRHELKPTSEQAILLAKHFGSTRWVYNYFLNQKQEQYKKTKKSDSYSKQAKTLTHLKKQEANEWLKEVNSQSLQHALKHLDTAYQNFFSKKTGYPKFKSKKSKQSFHVPQFIKVVGNRLIIPKFREGIKIILHRQLKGESGNRVSVRNCTITKTKTGKYFVSRLCNEEYNPLPKTGKSIGIDLGLTHLVITSNGQKFENHKYTKKYEKKLATAQKLMSRKVKGSNSFESQKQKVAKINEKIKNSRQDNLHKISYRLIKDFDVICLEDLNVKGMIKNPKLSKHIADASWSNFVRMVEYKADWNDKQVIKIDRFYPSCHSNHNLTLYDRTWDCGVCHTTHDRDVLAASNILKEGLKIKSLGTSDYMGGVTVRLRTRKMNKHIAKKPEAHPSRAGGLFTTHSEFHVRHHTHYLAHHWLGSDTWVKRIFLSLQFPCMENRPLDSLNDNTLSWCV